MWLMRKYSWTLIAMIQNFGVRLCLPFLLRALSAFRIPVCLEPSVDLKLTGKPVLVFKIMASERIVNNTDFESMRASLEVSRVVTKTKTHLSRLIKVGTAIAEVREHLKPYLLSICAKPMIAQFHR